MSPGGVPEIGEAAGEARALRQAATEGAEGRAPAAGIAVKRVYDPPAVADGERVLVDRLWPRGLTKGKAAIAAWRRDLAPSDALRRWFGHDPARWDEFRARYRAELAEAGKLDDLRALAERARSTRITLLFAAADRERNNAVALRDLIADL